MSEGVNISGVKIPTTLPTSFSVVVRDSGGRILIYGFKDAPEDLSIKDVNEELLLSARC